MSIINLNSSVQSLFTKGIKPLMGLFVLIVIIHARN